MSYPSTPLCTYSCLCTYSLTAARQSISLTFSPAAHMLAFDSFSIHSSTHHKLTFVLSMTDPVLVSKNLLFLHWPTEFQFSPGQCLGWFAFLFLHTFYFGDLIQISDIKYTDGSQNYHSNLYLSLKLQIHLSNSLLDTLLVSQRFKISISRMY